MNLDLSILNPEQLKAVTTTDGPLLILAGAGSGKTRVLTYRIAHILQQQLARPEQILAVTFTNKAAGEMKQRVADLLGGSAALPWMGTFHAICLKILKRDGQQIGLNNNFTIYDPDDQLGMIKEAMEELQISVKEVNPRTVQSYISSAKNEMVGASDYSQYAQGYFQELVADIYPKYQQLLRSNNAVDFDDLLFYVVDLFRQFPKVLEKYQHQFQYILIDEYQDTNHVQYLMVKELSKLHQNLCVVGDDDQSIYAFRGATIRNILNFERDFPNATVVKLEQNYRSTGVVLDAAHAVVSKNKQRTNKKLWTAQKGGGLISLYTAEDGQDEARWVVGTISELLKAGEDPEEVVVLYRTNAQSRVLEEAFLRQAVPYRIIGGVRFYERREVKDVLAYLRIAYNPQDDTSLKRIINVPRRGIGPKALLEVELAAKAANLSITQFLVQQDVEKYGKQVQTFATLIKQISISTQDLNIVDLINYVLEKTQYIQSLQDGTLENESRIENIKELISVAAKFHDVEPAESLTMFLEEVSLLEAQSSKEQVSGVTLMTIHAAKGLEFKHVFVVGLEEGLFPHARVSTEPQELEEERRLAYVALTRAKQHLYLVHAVTRVFFGARQNNLLSRFVEDIPDKLIEHSVYSGGESRYASNWQSGWQDFDSGEDAPEAVSVEVGERVKHEYFGVGKVVGLDDVVVKVDFGPVYGIKELSREYAPLVKL